MVRVSLLDFLNVRNHRLPFIHQNGELKYSNSCTFRPARNFEKLARAIIRKFWWDFDSPVPQKVTFSEFLTPHHHAVRRRQQDEPTPPASGAEVSSTAFIVVVVYFMSNVIVVFLIYL